MLFFPTLEQRLYFAPCLWEKSEGILIIDGEIEEEQKAK